MPEVLRNYLCKRTDRVCRVQPNLDKINFSTTKESQRALSVYRLEGYARGGIYKKLLSPCFRETSNEVAERVSFLVKPFGLEPALARG